MKLLRFFFVHSLRDLGRNRSRTAFALICVATGVAAVVALRSLAFMVADELTSNLAEVNRGDIRLSATNNVTGLVEKNAQGSAVFSAETVAAIREWAAGHGVQVTTARTDLITSVRRMENGEAVDTTPLLTLLIEPETYPFYSTITLTDGRPLAEAFGETPSADPTAESHPVVISSNLLRESTMGLAVGDLLRIGSSEALFEVVGVVPAGSETLFSTPQTVLLDFIYLPISDLPLLGDRPLPDQIYLQIPLGQDALALDESLVAMLEARFETNDDLEDTLSRVTVAELEEQNAEVADVIDDMILVMGLSSLLIGGIGIINTMLVVVSRRTVEIAVLKTLGLKGYRVTTLFLVEAALMGLLGSLIGVAFGVLLSYFVKSVGEEAFSLALSWRLYPEAMLSGLFLGMVITVLFGFLPTLIAGQVRPAIVLRPNEAQMPTAGLLQTMVTLMVMIAVLGLLVSSIVDDSLTISPVYMFAGGGILVGLFVGVIAASSGVGRPIPPHYAFRLPRRFEQLERWLTGAGGAVAAAVPGRRWQGRPREEQGRALITLGLRGLRQLVLLYGALAVAALLASLIMLIAAESWLPLQLGEVKPPGDVFGALDRGDAAWLASWLALTAVFGWLIRWYGRPLASLIALGTLGATVGGAIGWFVGEALAGALDGTGAWTELSRQATGVVLVEGALALLGAVFVGYWLLVWAIGKLPAGALLALVSLTLLGVLGFVASTLASVGAGLGVAVVLLLAGGGVLWLWLRRGRTAGESVRAAPQDVPVVAAGGSAGPVLLFSASLFSGGVVAVDQVAGLPPIVGVVAGLVAFLALWWALRRRYRVDGRLVLREMAGRRTRVASTLLGLSVGIAGLSLVSLTTGAVSHVLEIQLSEQAEGNLLVVARAAQQRDAIREALDGLDGIEHYSQFTTFSGRLDAVNGEPPRVAGAGPLAVEGEADSAPEGAGESAEDAAGEDDGEGESGFWMTLSERQSLGDLPAYEMVEGRALDSGDRGEDRIMLRESFYTEHLDLHAGDRLRFLLRNGPGEDDDVTIELEVVGIIGMQSEQVGFGDQYIVPPDTLSGTVQADTVMTIVQVDESTDVYMDRALSALSEVPGVIPIELSALTQLLENLIEQLNAIPTLVAWLALVAGTAIIANTVALATQERRRQIGVMKAVGLKGRRVLGMLMIENGLIGLLAGLIGAGVGLIVTVAVVLASQSPDELGRLLEMHTIGLLILAGVAVAIGAALLAAWGAAAEKPMNVLRYE